MDKVAAAKSVPNAGEVREGFKEEKGDDEERRPPFKGADGMGDKSADRKGQHPEQQLFNPDADRIKTSVDIERKGFGKNKIESDNEEDLYTAMPRMAEDPNNSTYHKALIDLLP